MKTKILEIFTSVDQMSIPDGDYPGTWGGYVVTAIIKGTQYRFRTKDGIRTPKITCIVSIRNGRAEIGCP